MGDDGLAIFGVAAGGDESAAMVGGGFTTFLGPFHVIRVKLKPGVGGYDVPDVEFYVLGGEARYHSSQLVAIFLLDMRPENFFGDVAEVIPVLGIVREGELDGFMCVEDFGGEEESVLIADLGRLAFEVYENPAGLNGLAKGFVQSRVGGVAGGSDGEGSEEQKKGCTFHRIHHS